ncbi:MAG: efflux RND transporter periplasmic adaptor subunit [Micropepsaceae bacterium]
MRFLMLAVPVVLIAGGTIMAVSGAWRDEPTAAVVPSTVPVTVAEAEPAVDGESIAATGTLVLKHETLLSFKVAGVIASLDVRAGDAIEAGQVLARLDQTEITAREREMRAQLELARKEHERSTELLRRGFVASRRVDDSKTALERAQAGFDVVRFDRRWTELRAPWDGVVLNRFAEAGEIVAPGRTVLAVGDTTGGFNLMAPIADRDVARLTVGDRANVTFAATDVPLTGRVARLSAKADVRTGSFEAEIALDAPPERLRSGMIGDATIFPSLGRTSAMLAIPAEAIVEGDGERASVYVLKGQTTTAALREVRVLRLEGSQALVLSGLTSGERVVVSGAAYLREGDTVRVVDRSAELQRVRP